MKYEVKFTAQFKRDLKLAKKNRARISKSFLLLLKSWQTEKLWR